MSHDSALSISNIIGLAPKRLRWTSRLSIKDIDTRIFFVNYGQTRRLADSRSVSTEMSQRPRDVRGAA